jgi:hypothetical protein
LIGSRETGTYRASGVVTDVVVVVLGVLGAAPDPPVTEVDPDVVDEAVSSNRPCKLG